MALSRGRTRPTKDDTPKQEEQVEEVKAAPEPELVDDEPPFDADQEQIDADLQAKKEEAAKRALEGKKAKPPAVANQGSSEVIPAPAASQNAIMQEMAEEGYEGLELGYGSFPILKLENEGEFWDTEENEYGDAFQCIIYPTRSKYVLKNTKTESKKEEEARYSYDRVTTTDGEPMEDIIADWAEQGWGYEIKHYLEAPAQLVGGEFDGEMVMLSIPPASKNKLSGYFYTNRARGRGAASTYITECYVGKKVTTAEHPYYPWKFKYVGPVED